MDKLGILILLTLAGVLGKEAAEYEEDFLQTFFIQEKTLLESAQFQSIGSHWLKTTAYKNAIGVSIENWTNHKLEFPEISISDGSLDRWVQATVVPRHTKDIVLLAFGTRGADSKGSVSFLIEDSWPRTWTNIGWHVSREGAVQSMLGLGSSHLDFEELKRHQSIPQTMQDGMRFYKATDKYVLSVGYSKDGQNHMLKVSLVPQKLDFWAWEKYYRIKDKVQIKKVTIQKVDIKPTQVPNSVFSVEKISVSLENEPGIFERKDLLLPGRSLDLQRNRTERELLTMEASSVAVAIRLENWSKSSILAPRVKLEYGSLSPLFPLVGVLPGRVELAVLKQSSRFTGVSGIIRWPLGDINTTMSLMISVPYNPYTWGTWAAIGIFNNEDLALAMPDFHAMYHGTPDSAWFVRSKTGSRLEFVSPDYILILDSDTSISKPVFRLALLPTQHQDGAPSVQMKLEGRHPLDHLAVEDSSQSVVSALSSGVAQCHCPCMGSSSGASYSKFIVLTVLSFQWIGQSL